MAQSTKNPALHMSTTRNDSARTRIAAIGIAATSAMVAVQAIQEAWSEETKKAPPMSAIARSTSWEEMLEPTMASATTPIVPAATDSGGSVLLGGGEGGSRLMDRIRVHAVSMLSEGIRRC